LRRIERAPERDAEGRGDAWIAAGHRALHDRCGGEAASVAAAALAHRGGGGAAGDGFPASSAARAAARSRAGRRNACCAAEGGTEGAARGERTVTRWRSLR